VLPDGGDWLLMRPDGVLEQDVRITLKTDDGAFIYVRYAGMHPEQHEVAVRRIGSNLGHPPQVWSHAVFWALRGTLAGLGPTLRPDRGASISE
jgi:hypothetical protein